MRLSTKEVQDCIDVFGSFADNYSAKLFLYGSRVRHDLKGGDIDLLFMIEPPQAESLNRKKHFVLTKLKEKLGDRRIDLTIVSPNEAARDAFLQNILQESILIHSWNE